jgi:hypothetical protein
MTAVLHVKTDNTSEIAQIYTLSDGQDLVKGLIECIQLAPDVNLWINEEGMLIEGLRPNFAVTWLLMIADPVRWRDTLIFGDVYFSGPTDDEGDMSDVPQDFLDRLKGVLT